MFSRRPLTYLVALSASLAGVSCGGTQASSHLGSQALLQVALEYSPNNPASRALPAVPSKAQPAVSPEKLPTEAEYESPIRKYFSEGNFDQLEIAAREAREGKGRVLGGVWKIADFYDAISKTFIGEKSSDADWKVYLDSVKQWISAKPESAAARISLANAYLGYAWHARGAGYANAVTESGWKLYGERVALAAATLAEAARLKEKSPYWYEMMQNVALAQGWDKSQARKLLEQAATFEPGYYHYYREYGYFLLPKWYGEEGETQSFAQEISDRIGGKEGDFVYFEIASLVACQCDAEQNALENMSWPRIKSGYATLEQLYGVSMVKRNRFASMAVKEGDRLAAAEALAQIGHDWDKDVWLSSLKFENAKAWATSQ